MILCCLRGLLRTILIFKSYFKIIQTFRFGSRVSLFVVLNIYVIKIAKFTLLSRVKFRAFKSLTIVYDEPEFVAIVDFDVDFETLFKWIPLTRQLV